VGVPIILVWQRLIDAIVEIFVVGEDNMATDIVELYNGSALGSPGVKQETYEAFWGDIGRSKTTRRLVGVNNHP
jgi:hypothetical protein